MIRALRITGRTWVGLRLLSVTVFCAFIGCLPYSDNPVSDERNSVVPPSIIGDCYLVFPGDWCELKISVKPGTSASLNVSAPNESGTLETFAESAHAYPEGDGYLVSLVYPSEDNPVKQTRKPYQIMRLVPGGGGYKVYLLNTKLVENDIRQGLIKGTLQHPSEKDGSFESRISADGAKLLAYFRNQGDKAFETQSIALLTQTKPNFPKAPQRAPDKSWPIIQSLLRIFLFP